MGGELSNSIDLAYDTEKEKDYRSSRIGASIIGNPCEAFLAFSIRGFPELKSSPRLKRVFRDGHRIETTVIADLKKAGHTIYEKDPMTGGQYMWDKHEGYLVYYADAIWEKPTGDHALLEIKSMNDQLWNRFKSRGLAVSHPKYLDQLQAGMGYSGYRTSVLIAYNKDTSEYWDQVIEFDEIKYYALLAKAEKVLMGEAQKVGTDKADWRCKECPRRHVCWDGAEVPKDMRTCAHSYPAAGGWRCAKGCVGTCMGWERYEPKTRMK